MERQDLYRLPSKFAIEASSGAGFAFFVHLAHVSREIEASQEMVNTIQEVLSEVSSPFIIPLSGVSETETDCPDYTERSKAEKIGDYWSIPVELCWQESRVDGPLSPAVLTTVSLSQILYKRGLVKVEPLTQEDEEDGGLEEDEEQDISSEGEEEQQEEEVKDSTWLETELPIKKKFKGRGTHVDDVGQIYIHLHEKRKEFKDLQKELKRLQTELEFEESLDGEEESLVPFKENQAVLAPHTDGCLHRGSLVRLIPGGSKALVQYVDWGSLRLLDTLHLNRKIISDHRPVFSFRVVLGDVLPSYGDEWSDEAIDFIYENILYTNRKLDPETRSYHNNLKVRLLCPGQTEEPLLVSIQLFTPDPRQEDNPYYSPWVDLSTVLVKRGWAVEATPEQVAEEQREKWERFTFGRQAERLGEEAERRIFPGPRRDQTFQHLPRRNLQLFGGDILDCKVVSMLAWNVVAVHISDDEALNINRKIFNVLEQDGPSSPIVEDPR